MSSILGDRPLDPLTLVDTICGCLRNNSTCKHRRAERAARERQALWDALTEDDVRWLREMGWAQ